MIHNLEDKKIDKNKKLQLTYLCGKIAKVLAQKASRKTKG